MSDEKEPPLRLLTPDGRWAIEVSQAENGQFCVLVILDGTTTTESLFTEDSDKAIHWAHRQMLEAMRRSTNDPRNLSNSSNPV
jgi:translation elongation factor EF-G